MKSHVDSIVEFILEDVKPPKTGYHITLLKHLPNIMKKGLVPKKAWLEPKIYLFDDVSRANFIASDLGMSKEEDWVLLQVKNLDPKYLSSDEDYDDYEEGWEASLKHGGTFTYTKKIPPSDIKVVAKAIRTEDEYHDQFQRFK